MKNVQNMTKINWIAKTIIVIFILLSGCKKEPVLEPEYINSANELEIVADPESQNSVGCNPSCEKTVDLMAGQHIKIGSVHYKNNNSGTVDFSYTVNPPWKLLEVKLFVGDCSQIPKNSSGNTIPGQYPFKLTLPPGGSTSAVIQIPRQSVPTCGCIAAHADVTNTATGATETAWGKGIRFTYTNWAMYYHYCLGNCPVESEGCAKPDNFWYTDQAASNWPTSVTVGGFSYTRGDAIDMPNPDGSGMPDSKFCFRQILAIRLSGGTVQSNASVWSDIAICETYLNSLNQKLSASYLPTGNENARDAAERIKTWIIAHKCY